jgi:hypothetical protein
MPTFMCPGVFRWSAIIELDETAVRTPMAPDAATISIAHGRRKRKLGKQLAVSG